MAQSGTDQHQSSFAVRETAHHASTATIPLNNGELKVNSLELGHLEGDISEVVLRLQLLLPLR